MPQIDVAISVVVASITSLLFIADPIELQWSILVGIALVMDGRDILHRRRRSSVNGLQILPLGKRRRASQQNSEIMCLARLFSEYFIFVLRGPGRLTGESLGMRLNRNGITTRYGAGMTYSFDNETTKTLALCAFIAIVVSAHLVQRHSMPDQSWSLPAGSLLDSDFAEIERRSGKTTAIVASTTLRTTAGYFVVTEPFQSFVGHNLELRSLRHGYLLVCDIDAGTASVCAHMADNDSMPQFSIAQLSSYQHESFGTLKSAKFSLGATQLKTERGGVIVSGFFPSYIDHELTLYTKGDGSRIICDSTQEEPKLCQYLK